MNHRAGTLPEGLFRLSRGDLGSVEPCRRYLVGRHLEPHASDIVHVRKSCRNVPPFRARRLRSPDLGLRASSRTWLMRSFVRNASLDACPKSTGRPRSRFAALLFAAAFFGIPISPRSKERVPLFVVILLLILFIILIFLLILLFLLAII